MFWLFASNFKFRKEKIHSNRCSKHQFCECPWVLYNFIWVFGSAPIPWTYVHVLTNACRRWQLLTRMVVCVHGMVVLAPTHRRPCFSTYWSESIPIPIVLKLAFIRCRWRNNLRSMACFLIASLTAESILGYSSLFFWQQHTRWVLLIEINRCACGNHGSIFSVMEINSWVFPCVHDLLIYYSLRLKILVLDLSINTDVSSYILVLHTSVSREI